MHWCILKWKKTQQLDVHIHRRELGHCTAARSHCTKCQYRAQLSVYLLPFDTSILPALTPVLTTWAVQTHISYLLTWVLWAPGDPWSHLTLATFPSACDGPALQTDGGHYLRLLSDCLWEIADWVVGVLHQDICLWTMRRPKFRWGHILSGFIRSGVLVSLLPPWQTRKWLTISQDLMSYPLEFPWFLEIKFLLLIDERNFNQSSIWHFRSSNFSVAKTTQIPVCQ